MNINSIIRYFSHAHLNIKSVNTDSQVCIIINVLLPGVKLFAFVNILPTGGTLHIARGHQTYSKLPILGLASSGDFRGVKIRGKVFLKLNINKVSKLLYLKGALHN